MKNMMVEMEASFAPSFDQAAVESTGSAVAEPAAAPVVDAGQVAASASTPANPQAATSTPSPSTSSQPATEQMVEIKVDGKIEKVSLSEALSLAQQGRSFTKKSQQLADERNRFTAERQTFAQQERAKALREYQEAEQRRQANANQDPAERALSQVELVRQQTEDYLLSSTLAQVMKNHPNLDEHLLLAEGSRRGINSPQQFHLLEGIADEMAKANTEKFETTFNSRFDDVLKKGEDPRIKSYKDAVIAEYLESKKAKPAPVSGSGGTPSGSTAGPRKARNMNEASDIAIEILGGAKA